jgi:citrate synthase
MPEVPIVGQSSTFKPKKSVALSGTAAGNTALCTVGGSGNDLHYRGYDILDFATTCERRHKMTGVLRSGQNLEAESKLLRPIFG